MRAAWCVLWLIAGMAAVRVILAAAIPVLHDEAFYWLWARRLDWSYREHPPMIAYLIALATDGGRQHGALWIRLPAILIGPAIAYALFVFGRELFDERVGLRAVILYQLVPALSAAGLFAVPDSPMLLGWVMAMRFAWQANGSRPWRWAACGASLGLALLSKLHAVFLIAGLLAFVALHARAQLRRPALFAGAALVLVFTAPIVYWNSAHDWAMFRWLLHERWTYLDTSRGLESFGLLLTQHMPLVQLLLPAFVWALWAAWRQRRDQRFAYLFWTSVPVIAVALALTPRGVVGGHLLAPAYFSLALVLAALWPRPVTWLAAGNAALLVGVAAFLLLPWLPPVPGAAQYYGFREAGARAREEADALGPGAVFVTSNYRIAAALGYHTGDVRPVLLFPNTRTSPAAIWAPTHRFAGRSAVTVT